MKHQTTGYVLRPLRRRALLAAATMTAGTLAAAGLPNSPTASGAVVAVGTSTLINLSISGADALGLKAFQGSYGTTSVVQGGGDSAGDFSDPDAVLTHVTVDEPVNSLAHS